MLDFYSSIDINNIQPSYKNDYTGVITISQFDVSDKPTYEIELFDAYPIAVNQLDLDWSTEGHHKLTVVFAYTYWNQLSD